MFPSLADLNRKATLARVLADLALVQLAALAALLGTLLWRATELDWTETVVVARIFAGYYADRFLPLSLVFPLVFLSNGFYTRSRGYAGRYKWLVVLRGSLTATLIFLFLNFLLSRDEIMPRSSVLLFGLFLSAGTAGVRWGKSWLEAETEPGAGRRAASPPERAPVLVVGGAGYIGSILCRKLIEAGERVRVLDSLLYGDFAIRELLDRPDFELLPGDCRNIQSVVHAMRGVKSVVHLAAIVGDSACEQDRQTALEINYAATRMMIEIAKGNGVERFLFASSCSVYGASEFLMDENSAVRPISLYAQTKVDSEKALLEARTDAFHPVILRLATVFGHGYRPRFDLVVNLLTAKACHEGVITIFNGQQWRPFIHVRDVAGGMVRVLRAPLPLVGGEVFNLGDSSLNFTLNQVAEEIRKQFPETGVRQVDNPDRRDYRVSFDKIRRRLGFQCRIDLADGIREMKRSFEQNAVADYTDARYHNQKFLQLAGGTAHIDRVHSRVMAAFTGD
ncbi:MAG: NAD(P)-dependent oxidoreductase [Acidobacteria bacterium]|nr:NAD(P)-dependent oxidoreductase [Acidobacteriota bacterium]